MRRAILAAVSTIVGLVLLLSFKTQASPSLAALPATAAASAPGATAERGTGTDRAAEAAPGAAPAATTEASPATTGAPATTRAPTATTAAAPVTTAAPTTTSAPPAGAAATVLGDPASTRYGPVQVQIIVVDGRISSVRAVEYPTGTGRDRQISAYAVPELNREALAANSAQIDMVSGATYTSEGYVTSLQSALDQAGLG